MKKYLLAIVASILILGGPAALVLAQTSSNTNPGNGFRVSPVREELTIQPGKGQSVDVTVENITSEDVIAHPVINDFVASDQENGEPRIILDDSAPPSGNSIKTLIAPLPDIPLKAHERKTVKVAINVPGNAAAGGYYGAVRFSPAGLTDQKQVALTASVGVIFLIKVPGNILEKLDVVSLSAAIKDRTKTLFMKSPDATVVRLKNSGAIHLQPFGRIEVKDWHGRVISNQEFNNVDPRGNVLPNSIRRFSTPLKANASLGRYTISANLGYGDNGQLISAQSTFWVIPLWFIILVGVLVVLIVLAISYVRRRKRKKNKHYR
jgi:hypothetical protein